MQLALTTFYLTNLASVSRAVILIVPSLLGVLLILGPSLEPPLLGVSWSSVLGPLIRPALLC